MAVNLIEYFKTAKEGLEKDFIKDLLRSWDVFGELKFKEIDGLTKDGNRWQTLPTVAFRKLNAGYTASEGTTEDTRETLSLLGGDIIIDRVFARTKAQFKNQLELQKQMLVQALAFKFADAFINGNQAVDVDSFEGLKQRVTNAPSRMSVSVGSSGDSLKVFASDATMEAFIDGVNKAIKYVNGATHAFTNEDNILKLQSVLRQSGNLTITKDSFDRTIMEWNGVKFLDVGLKADKSTEIITSTETAGDGGADSTSIYFARLDTKDGLHGLQLAGTSWAPYDPLTGGEMETKPSYIRRVDTAVGLENLSQYAVARLYEFKMAAS
jgi:hypothetical protein